jgi:hypothetical protein
MKNVYENLNDLIEAAEKLGYQVSRLNDNRAVVFIEKGVISYTRNSLGGWYKGGN